MKILFLHRDLPPESYTGVAIQVHRLANALVVKGHQITIATFSCRPPDANYQVETLPPLSSSQVFMKPLLTTGKRFLIPFSLRNFKPCGYDIIHIHGDGAFIQYQKNFIRTFYGTAKMEMIYSNSLKGKLAQGLSYFFEKLEDYKCRKTACAVGISTHISQFLPSVSQVIPCMLPQEVFADNQGKPKRPTLLFMGSCSSRKQGAWAFDIYIQLKKAFPELVMYYIGSKAQADSAFFLSKYGGTKSPPIFFQQITQAELIKLYRNSWIYLSLSSYEGFGVSLIEAMACGCAVAATKTPGSKEIIKEHETGIFIDKNSAIKELTGLIGNHTLRNKLANQAQAQSMRYCPEVIAQTYEDLYHSRLSLLK